jgi:hypothetical protein
MRINGFKGILCLMISAISLYGEISFAENYTVQQMYGYLSRYQGKVYASSNWYIDAKDISEKLGTVLIDRSIDSKFELEDGNLILSFHNGEKMVNVAKINQDLIDSVKEGERIMVQTESAVKLKLIDRKSRIKMSSGFGCGFIGCSFDPEIKIVRKYLLELTANDGETICLNQKYDSKKDAVLLGKCKN